VILWDNNFVSGVHEARNSPYRILRGTRDFSLWTENPARCLGRFDTLAQAKEAATLRQKDKI
jgi:hypothetical protein